ncbi:MAG: hypothetical protein ACKON7_02910, partial [Planctomycetaceae bacterium]
GTGGASGDWYEGDFNYDGQVNSSDITLLNSTGLYGAGSYLPAAGGALAAVPGPASMVAVPEPSTWGLAMAAVAILVGGGIASSPSAAGRGRR